MHKLLILSIIASSQLQAAPGKPAVQFADQVVLPNQTCVQAIIKTFDDQGNPLGNVNWEANWKVQGSLGEPTMYGKTNERGISQVGVKSLSAPGGILILEVSPQGYPELVGSAALNSANGEYVYWVEESSSGMAKGYPNQGNNGSLTSFASFDVLTSFSDPGYRASVTAKLPKAALACSASIAAWGYYDCTYSGTTRAFGEGNKVVNLQWLPWDEKKQAPPISRMVLDYSNIVSGMVETCSTTANPEYSGAGTAVATISMTLPVTDTGMKNSVFITTASHPVTQVSINPSDYSDIGQIVIQNPAVKFSRSLATTMSVVSTVTIDTPASSSLAGFTLPLPTKAEASAKANGSVEANMVPYYITGCDGARKAVRHFDPTKG